MPECKVCGTELDFDDTVDQWSDEEIVEIKNIGHCPNCGKRYRWRDIYKYSHYEDLEEE